MRSTTLALLLPLLLGGCVTVRSAPPRFDDPWPPRETGPRPALVLNVSGTARVDDLPRALGPILDDWGAQTERAYRDSALFAEVAVGRGRGDVRVDVELHADVSDDSAFLTMLSYLTILVLPSSTTTDIAMTTSVTTADGRPLGTFEARGRSRTWYQLLLFPFAPSFEPRRVTPEIVYDLNRQSITMLHARGVF